MQITRQADYAVRAVLFLALKGDRAHASTAQIARAQSIPVHFLAKIISQLSQAGILRTRSATAALPWGGIGRDQRPGGRRSD
jgi:Rrf2 family protein